MSSSWVKNRNRMHTISKGEINHNRSPAKSNLNTRGQLIIIGAVINLNGGGAYMDGDATSKERLVNDLKTLVSDAEELLKATASQAGEKISEARQKIEQSLIEGKKALTDAEVTLRQKSKEAAEIADDYVRENPWGAVGIAAAVGLAIGLLIRGK
jgi:ElaB/YqjD/DUF883 family membrane-anchored ribosome-binding protein